MSYLNTGANAPYYYNYINANTAPIMPSTVHVQGTGLPRFFARHLLQRAMSVFDWDLPEHWDKSYFLYALYCYGFVAVLETDAYGVIPQVSALGGYNVFYRPSFAIVANPLIENGRVHNLVIGEDCEIIKLQPDYCGVMDTVSMYADMLALAMEASAVNLVNSHLSYAFIAENKAAAEALKKVFDDVASGEPAVVLDRRLYSPEGAPLWQAFSNDLKNSYLVTDLLNDMRTLYNQFDTEIGIPNANVTKRERLISDEVNANNAESVARAAMWLDEVREAFERVNARYGLRLGVRWRNNPEGVTGDEGKTIDTGSVSIR